MPHFEGSTYFLLYKPWCLFLFLQINTTANQLCPSGLSSVSKVKSFHAYNTPISIQLSPFWLTEFYSLTQSRGKQLKLCITAIMKLSALSCSEEKVWEMHKPIITEIPHGRSTLDTFLKYYFSNHVSQQDSEEALKCYKTISWYSNRCSGLQRSIIKGLYFQSFEKVLWRIYFCLYQGHSLVPQHPVTCKRHWTDYWEILPDLFLLSSNGLTIGWKERYLYIPAI